MYLAQLNSNNIHILLNFLLLNLLSISYYTKTSRHQVQGMAMHAFKRVHYLQRIYTCIYICISAGA